MDGQRIRVATRHRYILLNKPRGYMTTRKDPERRPTVLDLLPEVREYIYPVGRLDYDSEGLLLLTNDGELAERLLHPSHEVEREYHARVRGVPDETSLERMRRGMVIEGRRTAPAVVRLVEHGLGAREDQTLVSIALHEGRTRQVRNMCDAIGHPVVRLKRVRIGPISDRTLKVGEHRDLTPREVALLKQTAAAVVSAGSDRRPKPDRRPATGSRVQAPAPQPAPRPDSAASPAGTSASAERLVAEPRAEGTGRSDRPRSDPRISNPRTSASILDLREVGQVVEAEAHQELARRRVEERPADDRLAAGRSSRACAR